MRPKFDNEANIILAAKLWHAQCDMGDAPNLMFELTATGYFVTGTTYDDQRVTVQVGFDSVGAYVWNGRIFRHVLDSKRMQGTLVLDPCYREHASCDPSRHVRKQP